MVNTRRVTTRVDLMVSFFVVKYLYGDAVCLPVACFGNYWFGTRWGVERGKEKCISMVYCVLAGCLSSGGFLDPQQVRSDPGSSKLVSRENEGGRSSASSVTRG